MFLKTIAFFNYYDLIGFLNQWYSSKATANKKQQQHIYKNTWDHKKNIILSQCI